MAFFVKSRQAISRIWQTEREYPYSEFFLLLIALILVIIAIVWEALLTSETANLWMFRGKIWVEIVREFAFACFIAWVVAATIEKSSKRRQEAAAAAMQRRIADDVFRGVYSSFIPAKMIDAVTNHALKTTFIRDYINLTYEIRENVEEDPNTGQTLEYVTIDTIMDYTIKNISDNDSTFIFQLSLDSSTNSTLRKYVKLKSLMVDDKLCPLSDINTTYNNKNDATDYSTSFSIKSQQTLRVNVEYTVVKNKIDTLIWSTAYPTLSLKLDVVMNADLKFIAHALYRNNFVKTQGGTGVRGLHKWSLDDVIFPSQGVVIFWQPEEKIARHDSRAGTEITSALAPAPEASH